MLAFSRLAVTLCCSIFHDCRDYHHLGRADGFNWNWQLDTFLGRARKGAWANDECDITRSYRSRKTYLSNEYIHCAPTVRRTAATNLISYFTLYRVKLGSSGFG